MRWKKDLLVVFTFVILFLIFSYLIFREFDLTGVVQTLGPYNYLLVPFMSIFGSNFLTAPFLYPILFLMKSNGLNVFLLAILAAFGGTAGDALFLIFGKKAGERGKDDKIFKFFEKHRNKPHVPLFVFLYSSFFPASNEIMTFALGYFKYPARKVLLPLILGNIVYYTLLISIGGGFFEFFL